MRPLSRTLYPNAIPIWQGQGKDIQIAQGGFVLSATGLVDGSVIPAGTPLIFDEGTRQAAIIGGGTLQAAATGNPTVYRVNKGHTLVIGNYLALTVGQAAYAITAIDTSNAAYDAVTVGTTLGNAAVGASVFVSTATGANAAAYGAANGLLYDDTTSYTGAAVSAVIAGTVYARRIVYTAGLAAVAGLSRFIWSQSK